MYIGVLWLFVAKNDMEFIFQLFAQLFNSRSDEEMAAEEKSFAQAQEFEEQTELEELPTIEVSNIFEMVNFH